MAKKPAKPTGARRGRPPKQQQQQLPQPEAANTVLLMPPEKTVQALAKAKRNAKTHVQSINGELGQLIAKAREDKHLDPKAFSMAYQFYVMADERLHITYFHFLKYIDDLGIPARAQAQEEMFDAHKAVDDDTNVRQFGVARQVEEQAGENAA